MNVPWPNFSGAIKSRKINSWCLTSHGKSGFKAADTFELTVFIGSIFYLFKYPFIHYETMHLRETIPMLCMFESYDYDW